MKNIILFLFAISIILPAQESRLLRFPASYGDKIVFTYAGDLYSVSSSGGVARKLTNDVGVEMFARFSPDGKNIAFTAQYDGNTEVYVMPAEGGIPKRLTFTATLDRDDVSDRMGPNNIVMTWKDNKTIVYRSRRIEFNDWKGQLFYTSLDGGIPEQLPVPRGGWLSFSPDGKKMAYNRVFREFRTWKRYRGGQADEIWIYDFTTKKTEAITNDPGQDIFPMWYGNKIYFVSDRDGKDNNRRLNLYSYNLETKETKQHTFFKDFDVKFPSLGNDAIVFEKGGYIFRFDLKTEAEPKQIPIQIKDDFDAGRGGIIDVSKNVTNYEISPDGNRALFGARGEIFTVPAKYGATRNITNSSGIHERNSKWSPDGKWISFVSDATGEDEIYIQAQDGLSAPIQLTKNSENYKYQPIWSPDGKKLLWADRAQRLQFVDLDSKNVTLVAESKVWEYSDYAWSPDSKWITYANPEQDVMTKIKLYSLDSKKTIDVTDGWYDSGNPVFSSDGKYLFFTSNRSFNPTYSWTEWNHAYFDMSKIYFVTLAKDTKSPFEPKSDEVKIKEEKKSDDKAKKDEKKNDGTNAVTINVKVDEDGLQQRVASLPISASNYRSVNVIGEKVYYIRQGSKDSKPKMFLYELDKQKETELGDVGGYEISADTKKMIVSMDGSYAIIDLPTGKIDPKDKLNLSDMKMNLDRRAEWVQIFNESWRQMRDFFFAPNMHGVDWKKMKENYFQLLPFVNHRIDLTYVIGEMIGELNIGHAYVGGGDYPKAERIKLGLLGAKVERDASSKFYRITKILKGQNWDSNLRSPLTEIGVDVKEGEFITAINGKPTNEMNDMYEALVGQAGKQVKLKINFSAKAEGSREVTIIPIASEASLYYYNWVQKNIETVNKMTDGKVGYIHIPDMGVNGLNEFSKYFYPQLKKEALIIDDRGNGGGNVSPMIAERLNRQLAMVNIVRNSLPTPNPDGMHVGPKVCLLDEFSASDGDIFPYRFKKYGIGKLIGKRSWGGVVGIRGSLPFVDGGFLNRPEFSRYDVDGKEWIMEGYGVDPDIVVDNDPAKEFEGTDEQLLKAIEVIKEELKNFKYKIPNPPPYPDKSK